MRLIRISPFERACFDPKKEKTVKKRQERFQTETEQPVCSRPITKLGFAALLCLLFCLFAACTTDSQQIVISEVVSSNTAFIDETLGTPDWIELHNRSGRDIDLAGYILTDKEDRYDLGNMLPNLVIPANGYVVLYARSNADTDAFCLPFGLSKSGDTLFLLDRSGNLLEKLIIPSLSENVSFARREDGSFGYCILPTPASANDTEISDVCPEIQKPESESESPAASAESAASETVLYISEIVTDAFSTGVFGGADWIELYNPNAEDVTVTGFFLSDREDKPDKAAFPELTIPANGYAAISCGGEDGLDIRLSSAGETVRMYDAALNPIDAVSVPALLSGQSWAKNRNGIFGYCGKPTPGAANDDHFIGIEQTRAADASEPLRLNEVLFRNIYSVIDQYGDNSDFVEFLNCGAEAVHLSEYWLSDDFFEPLKWNCPDVVLEPGEYRLIFLSGRESVETELHAPFSVSDSDSGLMLYHAATRTVQMIPWISELPKNTSVGLGDDGSLRYYKYPTPGFENAASVDDVKKLGAFPADDIYISEVSASGASGDWIELRNGSGSTCSLSGWFLTDDPEKANRFPLDGELASSACRIFRPDTFGIAANGETVFLYAPDGTLRDLFETGDLCGGSVTSGRTNDPSVSRVFFLNATPGETNPSEYLLGRTSFPCLSETGLYHTEPFSVSIRCADPDAVIRYTLDGSEPTESSTICTEPIKITESVTLRVTAQSENRLPSRILTVHYLFVNPHTLPVVCIACDPKDFKAFTRVNTQGRYPHTDAQITFYETDGTLGTSFPADINPRGNQSIKNPQKSMSLHLRTRLGQGTVNYPFWGEGTALDYASLILRNGSQDYAKARLRDSFALYAVSGLSLDSARTRPVVVYVNGAYYGIMDLNECMNQDYLVTHYDADPAAISHISTNETVRYGTNTDFIRVRKYAQQEPFANDSTVAEFAQWVDVNYIIDYVIAQTFFCNYDVKNQSYWATSDYSIRWRPVFYDIDRCFTDGSSKRDLFSSYFSKNGVLYDAKAGHVVNMDLYAALRRNPAWCDQFLHRYAELLQTDFSVERLQSLLDRVAGALRPEMEQHIALYHAPASMAEWEKCVASMRKEIAVRHEEIQNQICSEFHITRSAWNAIMQDAAKPH